MEKDILSLFVTNETTKNLVKQNARLAFLIVIFSLLYSAFDLFDWYKYIFHLPVTAYKYQHYFYRHTVRPIISIITITLGIVSHVFVYKGYKLISNAIENMDAISLNEGFKKFYIVNIFTVIIFAIITTNILYRYLFTNL